VRISDKTCFFRCLWLTDSQFHSWLTEVKDSREKAFGCAGKKRETFVDVSRCCRKSYENYAAWKQQ